MAHQLTTCTFCGVGCGIYLETDGQRILGAYPSMSHPSNHGRICVRGWHVHEVASSPDRLRQPLIREKGHLRPASWEEAIYFIADRIRAIRQRWGADSIGFFNAPRCSNEEAFLLQKLARAVVGTNNVDHGLGVYANNSLHVLLEMLGVPAATNSLGEILESDVIVVDGVDLGMQLPTVAGLVIRAKLAGARLIVIDPRRHRVAEHADHLLQLRPGTDVHLYGAMAKVIFDRGLANAAFLKARCTGHESFTASLGQYDLLTAAEVCGVPAEAIENAALTYARARTAALLFSTGAEARNPDSIRAMVNLALLCGQLGRPGSGIFPLTEQNNLQGVCDMGMLPDLLPGYRPVDNLTQRARFEAAWGTKLPAERGAAARTFFGHHLHGRFKAAWLCRYDPVTTATFCDAATVLRELDLVVVQHLFMTATAEYAHVILPGTAFGEEQVTFTSTDRRVQLAAQAIPPLAGTKPAWQQLMLVARALGADWRYLSAADVMAEIGRLVPDYSGISYHTLATGFGRQWPCTVDRPLGTKFLFGEDSPTRPFRTAPVAKPSRPACASEDFPFGLVFGHSLYYWHHNTLIRHSETLKREYRLLLLDYPEGFVEVNDADAKALGVRDGGRIRLVTPGGSTETVARVTREVRTGTVFVPFFVREVERQILGRMTVEVGALDRPVCVRVEKA